MLLGPRAGVYLTDERFTVAVSQGRAGAQCFAIEASDTPGARLKAELDTRKLHPRRIRLGLSRALVTVKSLELPRAAGAQMDEMVAFELERHVPFPPEDMRFGWTELPGAPSDAVHVLVAAAERRTVEGALRILEESRIRPGALTVASHDLPALLARRRKERAVVWAHRAGGSIEMLFLQQGRLRLSRTVPAGSSAELADEIAATLGLLGWSECDAIWISGDAGEPSLAAPELESLASTVSAPPWSPAAERLLQDLPGEELGHATLALAVALGSNRPELNLLAPELRPRTFSAGQLVTAGTVTATLLLAVGLVLAQGYKDTRYAMRLSEAIRQLDPEVKAVERLSAELAQKRRLLQTIDSLEHAEVRPLPIMRELTDRLPADAWLRTFSMDKQGLEITGQAAAANQLIPLLENSPSLTRVEFTAPVTKAGDKEQFRIKAAWKIGSPPEPSAATPARPTARTPGGRNGAPAGR